MRDIILSTLDARTAKRLHSLERWLGRVERRRTDKPPPQVLVRTPGLEFEYGELNVPFHSASVGKVMTAVLIAQLVDEGKLNFGSSIGRLLPTSDTEGLPRKRGVSVTNDITVEHLLSHTSGLPDFLLPPFGYRTQCSLKGMVSSPNRIWTPDDLLDEARTLPAIGKPGEKFLYSDTAYVLLGRIAEEAAGARLAGLLRERIYEPSGMTSCSTPYDHTEMPENMHQLDIAPFWIGGHELSRNRSMSLDWAGGGIVGPAEDFVRFQRALHGGHLVSRENLQHMMRPRNRRRPGLHYGAGIMTLRFEEILPHLRGLPRAVGGLGATSAHMFYYPQHDAHVILNFHAASGLDMNRSFFAHMRIARIIADLPVEATN